MQAIGNYGNHTLPNAPNERSIEEEEKINVNVPCFEQYLVINEEDGEPKTRRVTYKEN